MLNFLVAEDRIKKFKNFASFFYQSNFYTNPGLNDAPGQCYHLEKTFYFWLIINDLTAFFPFFFLLYYFYFSVNSFETLGLKQTDCQLEKRDHRFVEKGSLLHWKITNSLSIQFQLLFFSLHDGQFFISCSFFYWSIHSSSKGLIKRLDQLIYYNICYV